MESLVKSVLEGPDFFADFRPVDFMYLVGALNLRAMEFEELADKADRDGYRGIAWGHRMDAHALWRLANLFRNKEKEMERNNRTGLQNEVVV